jgi:hypothetical protein
MSGFAERIPDSCHAAFGHEQSFIFAIPDGSIQPTAESTARPSARLNFPIVHFIILRPCGAAPL